LVKGFSFLFTTLFKILKAMKRFKKQYLNQTIVLASGLLIDQHSIGRDSVQKELKANPSFAYMFEDVPESADLPKQPVTGENGASDPRPKRTRNRNKK